MKRSGYLTLAAWSAATAAWIGICLFLSWQTGEETGKLSLTIARWILRGLAWVGISPEEAQFHTTLRLLAHFGVFFVAGILFEGTTEALLRVVRGGGWVRLALGTAVTAVALFADVPKAWIPGRHLTWSESALNAAGAFTGFVVMLVIWKLVCTNKKCRSCK